MDTENTSPAEKAILFIIEAAKTLNWHIAFPENDDNVPGMIIGTQQYVDQITSHLPD